MVTSGWFFLAFSKSLLNPLNVDVVDVVVDEVEVVVGLTVVDVEDVVDVVDDVVDSSNLIVTVDVVGGAVTSRWPLSSPAPMQPQMTASSAKDRVTRMKKYRRSAINTPPKAEIPSDAIMSGLQSTTLHKCSLMR